MLHLTVNAGPGHERPIGEARRGTSGLAVRLRLQFGVCVWYNLLTFPNPHA